MRINDTLALTSFELLGTGGESEFLLRISPWPLLECCPPSSARDAAKIQAGCKQLR